MCVTFPAGRHVMIQGISAQYGMGLGLYTCPHCGRSGLTSKDEPCPSCGGGIDTASAISSQLPVENFSIDKGVTEETDTDPPTLEELLEEQEKQRRHPEKKGAETLDLSPKTAATSLEAALSHTQGQGDQDDEDSGAASNSADKAGAEASGVPHQQAEDLGSEELDQLRELQERDREVRSHEQAHISAGGSLVNGGASYTYQTGPDGKQYAVGGEVSIDTSKVPNDPDATMDKARDHTPGRPGSGIAFGSGSEGRVPGLPDGSRGPHGKDRGATGGAGRRLRHRSRQSRGRGNCGSTTRGGRLGHPPGSQTGRGDRHHITHAKL